MDEKTLNMMEEVIEKLQHIDEVYENEIPEEYIDRIREIWCDMKTEVEIEKDEKEDESMYDAITERELVMADMLYEENLNRKWGF